jgi:hypothetical protein
MFGVTFEKLNQRGEPEEWDEDNRFGRRSAGPTTAEAQGFSLHAGVHIKASDREGRERLFRHREVPLSLGLPLVQC